jgi:hypothetical protein
LLIFGWLLFSWSHSIVLCLLRSGFLNKFYIFFFNLGLVGKGLGRVCRRLSGFFQYARLYCAWQALTNGQIRPAHDSNPSGLPRSYGTMREPIVRRQRPIDPERAGPSRPIRPIDPERAGPSRPIQSNIEMDIFNRQVRYNVTNDRDSFSDSDYTNVPLEQ